MESSPAFVLNRRETLYATAGPSGRAKEDEPKLRERRQLQRPGTRDSAPGQRENHPPREKITHAATFLSWGPSMARLRASLRADCRGRLSEVRLVWRLLS